MYAIVAPGVKKSKCVISNISHLHKNIYIDSNVVLLLRSRAVLCSRDGAHLCERLYVLRR